MKSFNVDFIGIGAQKAATTWIYKCLLEHPEIDGYSGKESHFFSKDRNYNKKIRYYQSLFSQCESNKIIGEFSTSYLTDKNAPARIYNHFPNVKIIVSLRNPVDRFISRYRHIQGKNKKLNYLSILDATRRNPELIEFGLYAKYLKNYFDLFPRKNIKIVFYEDILVKPHKTVKQLYQFLNVDNIFQPSIVITKLNTAAIQKSKIFKFINKIYFKLYNREWASYLLIKPLKKLGVNYKNLNNILARKKEGEINIEDRKKLFIFFQNDINRLEKLLNKDLSHWKVE
ncbi:sulfotransferase domain-containing protein [Candidatus Parcubacteria bacterium]|nr:sulfotransferase domain-containing protein [Candidatus Parcubacteria bacterium]